jgi:hypothetical protein
MRLPGEQPLDRNVPDHTRWVTAPPASYNRTAPEGGTMGQLSIYERGAVERAQKILADIKADRSTPDYARHLGRLEVTARTLLTIIENLTADGEDGKGAA